MPIPLPPSEEDPIRQVLPTVYERLRALAASYLATHGRHSIGPTELVHETYIKLVRSTFDVGETDQILAVAAMAMRQVLIDRARRKLALRRSGGNRVDLDLAAVPEQGDGGEELRFLEIDARLCELAVAHPRASRVAEMLLFAGMTQDQAAAIIDVSRGTVAKDWEFAKGWLSGENRRRRPRPA